MVRPRSWHWDHFYQSNKKFGNNNTHWAAYCNYCTSAKLATIELQEKQAVREGKLEAERSKNVLIVEARDAIHATAGKLSVMNNHLIQCEYCPDSIKARARKKKVAESNVDDGTDDGSDDAKSRGSDGKRPVKRVRSEDSDVAHKTQKAFTVYMSKGPIPFNGDRQQAFEDQILRAFVSAGFAFYSIHDPEVRKLFQDYLPAAKLPNRKSLSGKILTRQVVKMEGELRESGKGQYATMQCDGYKDTSKNHLIAFMYSVLRQAHVTNIHDMSAKRKTAANVFALMVAEYEYLTTQIGLKCIGIAGDAAGDERKARLDMLRERPNLLIADCWAHQICLILGDYVRGNPKIAEVIDSAVEVVKWFNVHSYALGMFRKEQRETYGGKEWCLIMPVITRWTAYFASFDRLLKLRKALQVTAIKHEQELIGALGASAPARKKLKARRVLSRIKDDSWWKKLVVIKTHFEPLAIAINVTQGANSRCDQVSFLLAKLYHSYSNLRQADCNHPESSMTEEEHPVTSILESIEKRWRKADQDLHIAAFFLNPFINKQLLDSEVIPISMMMGILRRLYIRVFEVKDTEDVPSDFMMSVYHYSEREGIFSKDAWAIEQLRKPLAAQDGTTDPIIMWKLLPKKNSLAQLAILILSFVPNSTNTERLFTMVTDTKSKKRNRLHTEKLRKIVFVKLELRRQQAIEGTARARLKRHFGNDSTGAVMTPSAPDESGSRIEEEDIVQAIEEGGAESETDEEDMAGTTADLRNDTEAPSASAADMSVRSFVVVAREWEEQASTEDQDVNDTELDERGIAVADHVTYGAGTPCRVRLYFGQPKLFDIAELFDFSVETGWDEFWFQGVKKYEEEALFYELLTSLDDRDDKEVGNTQAAPLSGAGEGSQNPIVVS